MEPRSTVTRFHKNKRFWSHSRREEIFTMQKLNGYEDDEWGNFKLVSITVSRVITKKVTKVAKEMTEMKTVH